LRIEVQGPNIKGVPTASSVKAAITDIKRKLNSVGTS
jgi:hypothetical protein